MATITHFVENQSPISAIGSQVFHAENRIDTTKFGLTDGDVVQLIKVPAQCMITDLFIKVETAEGAAATMTIGDGDSANGWDATTNLNATAGTVTSTTRGTDAYAVGKPYIAADTIDGTLVAATHMGTGIFTIHIVGFMLDHTIA